MLGTDDDIGGVVVVLLVAAAVAAVVALLVELLDSGMLFKGHKFVVCTRPRSKLKHSRTAAPTELRRVTMLLTMVHLFNCVSYFSTEFNDELPSLPPSAYKKLSISTTSCVDL